MQIIRNPQALPPEAHGCVATIGNFDGVHLGHQHIISLLQNKALTRNKQTMVIVFEPQPHEYFNPQSAPARLTRWREKMHCLAEYGIDWCVCLRFNDQFAMLSAKTFIEDIILKQLKIQELVIGEDFKFGKDRQGNAALLKHYAQQGSFQLDVLPDVELASQRVSSSLIRQALAEGDFVAAEHYLGRPYTLCGRVIHGDKQGREWDVPTANIPLKRLHSPLQGVFTVYLTYQGQQYQGVANLGTRPAVGGTKMLLEVHLLDFDGDLYGQWAEVEFLKKLREEADFENLDDLKNQIYADIENAKHYFATKT